MKGLCITDAVKQFGVTSKTLRYYERVGLLEAKRSDDNNYRYYDKPEVERIKQIMILRKMQISIKDIIRIYENEDMSAVVEIFVGRLRVLDDEIDALSELRRITDEFLQTMIDKGIKKISALPLLYEELDKKLAIIEDTKPAIHREQSSINENLENKPITYQELATITEKLSKPIEPAIIYLSDMRILTSRLQENPAISKPDEFRQWVQIQGIDPGAPGSHERFEFQENDSDIIILKITDDFINTGLYTDGVFDGGLFAMTNIYLDDDLSECFRSLISSFDENKYYEIDYKHDGSLRHEAMLENLISPDDKRDLVSLFIPVKKRIADPGLYERATEIEPGTITITEIEEAKIIRSKDAAIDKLIPLNNPYYNITEEGEAEYISWISTRVLSTGINVKLPFRVDIEFRIGDESGGYGHGVNDTGLRIYHGHHGLDHNVSFGVNMENNADDRLSKESIVFSQPVYKDRYTFPKRGRLNKERYNRVTWIVGDKHLACIINDEIRYCGVDFPYMKADFELLQPQPIIIGTSSSVKTYIKSIRVSQLAQSSKIKVEKGALKMVTKQSNNMIQNIHRLITDEYGENYWFNGCARYVMESLGEYKKDSDLMTDEIKNNSAIISNIGYWLFSGLTGDIFTHFYPSHHVYSGDSISCVRMCAGDKEFVESVFAKCGYAATYVLGQELSKNKEMYKQTLMAYIDKGIPVIAWGSHPTAIVGVFVGYEEYGKTLLYITGNKNEPERISFEAALSDDPDRINENNMKATDFAAGLILPDSSGLQGGWVFVGDKVQTRPIADIYREALQGIHAIMTKKPDTFAYGPEALRAWAGAIETGWFENVKPDEFDGWGMHTNFICVLATNGSCIHNFLWRAMLLNPDMTYLDDIDKLYKRTADIWNNDNGNDLEALGGGFNVTLEALQNKEKRNKIAAKINEAADCMDEVVWILQKNL